MVEVAAGRVSYWLQITGCVHRNLRAAQSVPSSSISTLQHDAVLLHSCFQSHWGYSWRTQRNVHQRFSSKCPTYIYMYIYIYILVQISVLVTHVSILIPISSRMLHYHACPGADSGSCRLDPKNLDNGQNVEDNLHIDSQLLHVVPVIFIEKNKIHRLKYRIVIYIVQKYIREKKIAKWKNMRRSISWEEACFRITSHTFHHLSFPPGILRNNGFKRREQRALQRLFRSQSRWAH